MKSLSMTEGKVAPLLIRFAIPLMLGDLFQQLYIAMDTAIVGRFAGDTALAAVSSSTFLIRMLIGLFVGVSAGASVVISHCVGAKEYEKGKLVIHTMGMLTLIGGIAISVFSIWFSPTLLQLVSTPAEIMEEATVYLQTYFMGSLFQLTYNVGAGVLRSFGDSKRPFIYLVISCVCNIILDYLFIAVFEMGVFGAAAATVIAQMISAICVLYAMIHTTQPYKLVVSKMRIHKEYVGEILQMGLPAGMQSVIVSLSNVLVQYRINMLGTAVIAGFGLFNKFDGVIMLPGSAFALATMTFVGQNFGAKKYERIKEGLKAMCVMRQIWLFIEDALGMGLEGILLSYPFSWLLTLAVTGLYILYLENSNKVRMKVQMEG